MDGDSSRTDGVSGSLSMAVHCRRKAVQMHADVVSLVCLRHEYVYFEA